MCRLLLCMSSVSCKDALASPYKHSLDQAAPGFNLGGSTGRRTKANVKVAGNENVSTAARWRIAERLSWMGWVPLGWLLVCWFVKIHATVRGSGTCRVILRCAALYIPTNRMSHLEREFLPWPKDLRLGEPPILDTHGPGSLKDANCCCRKERDRKKMHHKKKKKLTLQRRGPAGAGPRRWHVHSVYLELHGFLFLDPPELRLFPWSTAGTLHWFSLCAQDLPTCKPCPHSTRLVVGLKCS